MRVKVASLVACMLMLASLTSCSVDIPFLKSQDCEKIKEILLTSTRAENVMFMLKEPEDIRALSRADAESIKAKLLEIYPNLVNKKLTYKYVYLDLPDDQIKDYLEINFKDSDPDLFNSDEKANWSTFTDVQKYETLNRVEGYLFGSDDITSGPCGEGTGLSAANDIWGPYVESMEVLYILQNCEKDQSCFDPITKLQEICMEFESAMEKEKKIEKEMLEIDVPYGSVAYKRIKAGKLSQVTLQFLEVGNSLKASKLNQEDMRQLAKDYGYGKFSVSDLAFGISAYAHRFQPANSFYQFQTVCDFYRP